MNPNDEYKPRFAFEITQEQNDRAGRLLGVYRSRRALFSPILDDVLDLIEKHGEMVIGLIIDGRVRPTEIIPVLAKAKINAEKI